VQPETADPEICVAPAEGPVQIHIHHRVAKALKCNAPPFASGNIAEQFSVVFKRKLVALLRPSIAFAAPITTELIPLPEGWRGSDKETEMFQHQKHNRYAPAQCP
jgi:hypothetical protein